MEKRENISEGEAIEETWGGSLKGHEGSEVEILS